MSDSGLFMALSIWCYATGHWIAGTIALVICLIVADYKVYKRL